MKIEIPNHKAVSWNDLYEQKHWNKRHKLAKREHEMVWAYVQGKKVENYPVDIKITAYYSDKRRRDSDNVCDKVLIDGLKVAGVIEDDDVRYIREVCTEAVVGATCNKVVIEILETNE